MKDYSTQSFLSVSGIKKKEGFKFRPYFFIILLFFVSFFLINKQFLGSSKTYEFINPFVSELINDKSDRKKNGRDYENMGEVLGEIEKIVKEKQGIYGVFVNSLNDDLRYGINEDRVFTAASINKIPIVTVYLLAVENNEFSLSDTYKLKSRHIEDGSGTLQNQKIGSSYTYDELLKFIGKYSDNTATNVLIEDLGKNRVQEFVNEQGMSGTNINENKTSPLDMGMLFSKIYQDKIFKDKKTKDYFFEIFTNTEYETRIPAGVPQGVVVSHKIGNQIQVWSDCGVVFSNTPYSICLLTDEIRESEAKEILPQISRLIWEFERSKD